MPIRFPGLFHFEGFHYMDIKTVGIIGAGTMGNGIAQACAVSACTW